MAGWDGDDVALPLATGSPRLPKKGLQHKLSTHTAEYTLRDSFSLDHAGPGAQAHLQLHLQLTDALGSPTRTTGGSPKTAPAGVGTELLDATGVKHAGWLWKRCSRNAPSIVWKRLWFYIHEDRLCYLMDKSGVRYISFDRVPVRPLPHRREKQDPCSPIAQDIGVSLVDNKVLGVPFSKQYPDQTAFGVVTGSHTHFMVAETYKEAKAWVDAIRKTWLHCFQHTARGCAATAAGGGAVHINQHLVAHNTLLVQSIRELNIKMNNADSEYWRKWIEEKLRNKLLEEKLSHSTTYEVQIVTGAVKGAGTDARVYIEFEGIDDERTSGEVRLLNRDNPTPHFNRDQTDKFEIKCADVGRPTLLKVWHDNTGKRPDWFLEEIRLKKQSSNETVCFPCKRWLSTRFDDGRICRRLKPAGGAERGVQYRVVTCTSDLGGAATDANVWIVLHGARGDGQRQMLDPGCDQFERGGSNEFTLQEVELGELESLTIGHDSTGRNPAWHLDNVTVTHVPSQRQYVFRCGQWLDKERGDGRTYRTLDADGGTSPEQRTIYMVTVTTADERGAGTDAEVWVALHGAAGSTPRTPLLPHRPHQFERGQRDTFRLDLCSVGKLRELTLWHQPRGSTATAWHPELIEVIDEGSGITYRFPCDMWLGARNLDKYSNGPQPELNGSAGWHDSGVPVSSNGGGGVKRVSEVTLQVADGDSGNGRAVKPVRVVISKRYRIEVKTSAAKGSGTDARVELELFGEGGGSVGSARLDAVGAFERGQTDSFSIEGAEIGRLSKIRISTDSTGSRPAWHPEFVKITVYKSIPTGAHATASAEVEDVALFPCGFWLDKEHGFGRTVARNDEPPVVLCQVQYKISVATSDIDAAATDANIEISLVGEHGQTAFCRLLSNHAAFERGQVDHFEILGTDVGRPKQCIVRSDGSGNRASWHLDRVTVVPGTAPGAAGTAAATAPPSAAMFVADRWLNHKSGLVAVLELYNPAAARVQYDVEVNTQGVRGSGDGSGLSLDVTGSKGCSSGVLLLSEHRHPQARAPLVARLLLPDLGEPQLLTLRNEEHAPCFVDSVVLTTATGARYFFPFGGWLTGTHQLRRAPWQQGPVAVAYEVVVTTTRLQHPSQRDDAIAIGLNGAAGAGEPCAWSAAEIEHGMVGMVHKMRLRHKPLGELKQLLLRAEAGQAPWQLQDVQVTEVTTQQVWHADCFDWINAASSCEQLRVDLKPGKRLGPSSAADYEVTLHTGSSVAMSAGDVPFIELFGGQCGSKVQLLYHGQHRTLAANAIEVHDLRCKDVGPLTKIAMGLANAGPSSKLQLSRVEVLHKQSGKRYIFTGSYSLPGADGKFRMEVPYVEASAPIPPSHAVIYDADIVFGKGEGDIGVAASMHLELSGSKGECLTHTMPTPASGATTTGSPPSAHCQLTASGDLGELRQLRLRLETRDLGFACHLDTVVISNANTGRRWYFYCGHWLKGGPSYELLPSSTDRRSDLLPYKLTVHTGSQQDSATAALVGMFVDIASSAQRTGPQLLPTASLPGAFQAGTATEVTLQLPPLTEPLVEVRVWCCSSATAPAGTANPESQVELVELLHPVSGKVYFFSYGKQGTPVVAPGRGFVLPVLPADPRPPVVQYRATVVTSDVQGAGTDARVLLMVYGDQGATRQQQLKHSDGRACFKRGTTDIFDFTGPQVGRFAAIRIGHDNSGAHPAWHLHSVRLQNLQTADVAYFLANRWLGRDVADGQTELELQPTSEAPPPVVSPPPPPPQPMDRWQLTLVTGDDPEAGTTADVSLTLRSGDRKSGPHALPRGSSTFQRGGTDVFQLEAPTSLGVLTELLVCHDGRGASPAWQLASMHLLNTATGAQYQFTLNCWLNADCKNRAARRPDPTRRPSCEETPPITPQRPAPEPNVMVQSIEYCDYRVEVQTTDVPGAGTQEMVYLEITGRRGTLPLQPLTCNSQNAFQAGQLDIFTLGSQVDVGELSNIRIGHTCRNALSSWHLAWVRITNLATNQHTLFPCNGTIQADPSRTAVPADLVLRRLYANVASKQLNISSPRGSMYETASSYRTPSPSSRMRSPTSRSTTGYKITLHTSNILNAGASGKVSFELQGQLGSSGVINVSSHDARLERGCEDVLLFPRLPFLGDLYQMHVSLEHGMFASWHLRQVEVVHVPSGGTWTFDCHGWVDKKCNWHKMLLASK